MRFEWLAQQGKHVLKLLRVKKKRERNLKHEIRGLHSSPEKLRTHGWKDLEGGESVGLLSYTARARLGVPHYAGHGSRSPQFHGTNIVSRQRDAAARVPLSRGLIKSPWKRRRRRESCAGREIASRRGQHVHPPSSVAPFPLCLSHAIGMLQTVFDSAISLSQRSMYSDR